MRKLTTLPDGTFDAKILVGDSPEAFNDTERGTSF
jgi:hypothetical protein